MRNYKHFCKAIEEVENYEKALADNFISWHCHHRLETHNSDGERRPVNVSREELKALDMYWNRPAEELIFLTISEHTALHHSGKPKPKTAEHRKKISETLKGNIPWNKGEHLSIEHRRKIGEKSKGRMKGRHWYNNGKITVRCCECPPGFVPGRIPRSGI